MLVAESRELVLGAAQVQRAFRFQVRHQHRLVRAEDLGALAHEAHTGHHQHPRRMGGAEAGHFQRIAHAAAGFQGQILDVGIYVVVGHQYRIAFVQQGRNACFQRPGLIGAQGIGHLGPGLTDAAGRGGGLRVGQVIVENPVQDFHHRRDPPRWGRGYGLCGTAGRVRVGGGGRECLPAVTIMLSLSIIDRNSGIDRNPWRVRTGLNGETMVRCAPDLPFRGLHAVLRTPDSLHRKRRAGRHGLGNLRICVVTLMLSLSIIGACHCSCQTITLPGR